mgnify:CR=1 FL=1
MIRVLQCVNNMHRAGLETMLMNYYRNVDRTQIQFDFLTHRPERSDYDDEIESLGGRVYYAPRLYPQNYPAYFSYMKRFFREHPEYRIVHSHIDAMSFLPLLAAKQAGIPVRIAHSHNTAIDRDFKYILKQAFRTGIPSVATHRFACGEAAGEFLFRGRDFRVIANAVDARKFAFREEVRKEKRRELAVSDRFVVGHVGRFCYQKNHALLLEIFGELRKLRPDALLLLVGTGELEQEVRQQACQMGLDSDVRFLGNRGDVSELYQAMDAFVLPSRYEGLPMVGVEAQFAGLPCFFSDRVTREVAFTEGCRYLPVEEPTRWAEEIMTLCGDSRGRAFPEPCQYDIRYAYSALEALYRELDGQITK